MAIDLGVEIPAEEHLASVIGEPRFLNHDECTAALALIRDDALPLETRLVAVSSLNLALLIEAQVADEPRCGSLMYLSRRLMAVRSAIRAELDSVPF